MIDQEVLLLKDLMNRVDSSKREALLNLQKELSLRPDLKIKSYDGVLSFDSFLGYFYKYSKLELMLLEALHSEKNSKWLEKVKRDNHLYFLVYNPVWKTNKIISDVQLELVLISEDEIPVLEIIAS